MPSYENQFTLRINRLFLLAYKGGDNRVTADFHRRYYVARVEIKNTNLKFMEEVFMIIKK